MMLGNDDNKYIANTTWNNEYYQAQSKLSIIAIIIDNTIAGEDNNTHLQLINKSLTNSDLLTSSKFMADWTIYSFFVASFAIDKNEKSKNNNNNILHQLPGRANFSHHFLVTCVIEKHSINFQFDFNRE